MNYLRMRGKNKSFITQIKDWKIKVKAKLFRAATRRKMKMLLSFFNMRKVTKEDLSPHPSGCCLDFPARSWK